MGLFSTDNLNGTNTVWQQEGANTIGNVVINMITSRTFDHNIVVATHGNGIYSNKIFTPSSVGDKTNSALSIKCFPNPFNDFTAIEISEEVKGEMTATIYDIAGRMIQQLYSNTNRINWNGKDISGRNCAEGTYFVKVSANGKTIVKKLVKL